MTDISELEYWREKAKKDDDARLADSKAKEKSNKSTLNAIYIIYGILAILIIGFVWYFCAPHWCETKQNQIITIKYNGEDGVHDTDGTYYLFDSTRVRDRIDMVIPKQDINITPVKMMVEIHTPAKNIPFTEQAYEKSIVDVFEVLS